jgi:hypothetical protein
VIGRGVCPQPRARIFNALDSVLFMAKGGSVVFQGDPEKAVEYFTVSAPAHLTARLTAVRKALGHACPDKENPADHLMDIVSATGPASARSMPAYLRAQWEKARGGVAASRAVVDGEHGDLANKSLGLLKPPISVDHLVDGASSSSVVRLRRLRRAAQKTTRKTARVHRSSQQWWRGRRRRRRRPASARSARARASTRPRSSARDA